VIAMIFRWFVSFLVWLSADPGRIASEPARAAAAVASARSFMVAQSGPADGVETLEAKRKEQVDQKAR
jgi:hypothetical protein